MHPGHDLLPDELAKQIPGTYTQETNPDPTVWVKYFTPDAGWTWYAYEYDPKEREFFGLVKGFVAELGYFSLDELEAIRGPLGLKIERDLYFKPCPLSHIREGKVQ